MKDKFVAQKLLKLQLDGGYVSVSGSEGAVMEGR